MTPSERIDRPRRSLRCGFAAVPLDRVAHLRRDERWIARQLEALQTRFLPVWRGRVLVRGTDPPVAVTLTVERLQGCDLAASTVLLGRAGEQAYFALELDDQTPWGERLASRGRFCDLRTVAALLNDAEASLLAYARAMIHWRRQQRFCGRCGAPTRSDEGGHVCVCTASDCGAEHFPRTDPAIIVRVTHRDRCLLARQPRWPAGRYSVLAGFVEPGETLEAAVVREVGEEVGLSVEGVSYVASQPWPFPASLMVGFAARARGEALHLDQDELEDARWFSRDALARALRARALRLPPPLSIAFGLVEAWFNAGAETPLRDVIGSGP